MQRAHASTIKATRIVGEQFFRELRAIYPIVKLLKDETEMLE